MIRRRHVVCLLLVVSACSSSPDPQTGDAAAPPEKMDAAAESAADAVADAVPEADAAPTGPLGKTDGTVAPGWYCGSNKALFGHLTSFQDPSLENNSNLFTVDKSNAVTIIGYCTGGCATSTTGHDHCNGPSGYPARGKECFNGSGAYCGHTLGIEARSFPPALDKEGLFACSGQTDVTLTSNCDCEVNPGISDTCSTSGPGGSRKLYVAYETSGSCPNTLTSFFQCLLGHTDLNNYANGYTTGYPLHWGGIQSVSASCGSGWQCVEDAAKFPLQPFDVLLVVTGTGIGGQNFWDTVVQVGGKNVSIHSAAIGDGAGSCAMQTAYGMHEVYEAISEAGAADCCDGEVPYTPSGESGCLAWNVGCAPACGQWGPTSCGGNGSYGLTTLDCGGTSYTYQRITPPSDEFGLTNAADCRTLVYAP